MVFGMLAPVRWRRAKAAVSALVVAAVASVLVGCGSSATSSGGSPSAPPCPVSPVSVVVTTNVWGSVVDQLAGQCANVNVIITSAAADPHDFEPTAATSAAFSSAKLIVQNGLGYDSWANRIEASLGGTAPPVLDLGAAVGLKVGANPHIWYSPTYVQQSAAAITDKLKAALPEAATYFQGQASTFQAALGPYLDEVALIKSKAAGTAIGATESLFAYMAQATGLNVTTPAGFMLAQANGTDPSAGDVATFRTQLSDGTDKALIYNTQTQGGLPTAMRQIAVQNNVPVVEVTETLTPEGATFQAWQLAQLQNLYTALGGK
ncbi:MAG: zinc ABC transporter substrate-binding protein [Actinomycetes bacterium]